MKELRMKISLVLMVVFVSSVALAATGVRVAYVDLQKALQTVEAGKKAKDDLEKEVASKKDMFAKKQLALQKEADSFEKKAAIMNEAARVKQQQEIQKKIMDFQKEAAETQMQLQEKERSLTAPLIKEFKSIIEAIGKDRGYQIILEKNESAVLYAEAGADLTDEVIQKFNARRKK